MNTRYSKALYNAAGVAGISIFMLCQTASAFNPQPEPPAEEGVSGKVMEPLDKARNPAPPPSPDKMHKAMEPGNDEKPNEMGQKGIIIENKPAPKLKR